MLFTPIKTQLLQAIKSNNASKVEELILNSDEKRELIIHHATVHGKDSLLNFLPQFRSKGLVLNIKNLLDI